MIENADSIIRINGKDRALCSSVDNYNNVPVSKTPHIYSTSETHAYDDSDLKNDYINKFTEKLILGLFLNIVYYYILYEKYNNFRKKM